MPKITINKPCEPVDHLVSIFPAFGQELDEGEAFGYDGDYTYHTVFLALGPQSFKLLSEASDEQIRKLCSLLNYLFSNGGVFENAVTTCFLEHASQLSVRNIIKPHLSKGAKSELR